MIIKAYAKINLLLNVLGTRPDGYHELETVMQSLALHDELVLETAPDIDLVVEGADLSAGPDNLAYRAADLLRERTGYRGGAAIRLVKRIPLAAGLAGGSADAAAVMRGLNELWNLNLDMRDLSALGAELGSDVPFCLRGGTALCRGRGELITPLPGLPAAGVILVKPRFGVSTADVYRYFDALTPPRRPYSSGMLEAVKRGDITGVAANLDNSLEQVTTGMHPVIAHIREETTAAGAAGVLMSGSGPTVFGIFEDLAAAMKAAGAIMKDNRWVRATSFYPGGGTR